MRQGKVGKPSAAGEVKAEPFNVTDAQAPKAEEGSPHLEALDRDTVRSLVNLLTVWAAYRLHGTTFFPPNAVALLDDIIMRSQKWEEKERRLRVRHRAAVLAFDSLMSVFRDARAVQKRRWTLDDECFTVCIKRSLGDVGLEPTQPNVAVVLKAFKEIAVPSGPMEGAYAAAAGLAGLRAQPQCGRSLVAAERKVIGAPFSPRQMGVSFVDVVELCLLTLHDACPGDIKSTQLLALLIKTFKANLGAQATAVAPPPAPLNPPSVADAATAGDR